MVLNLTNMTGLDWTKEKRKIHVTDPTYMIRLDADYMCNSR